MLEVVEYLPDHLGVFDAGNHLHRAGAFATALVTSGGLGARSQRSQSILPLHKPKAVLSRTVSATFTICDPR